MCYGIYVGVVEILVLGLGFGIIVLCVCLGMCVTLTLIFQLPSTYTFRTISCPRYYLGVETHMGKRCSRVSHTHLALPKVKQIDTANQLSYIIFRQRA